MRKLIFIASLCLLTSGCKKGGSGDSSSTSPGDPTELPSVSITAPAANTSTASIVDLSGVCTDGLMINITGGVSSPSTASCSASAFSVTVTLSGSDGSKTVTVSQTNDAGTASDSRNFNKDSSAPIGISISIDSGSSYTSSTSVNLTLAANSASEMYITNTAGCGSGGTYEAYGTSKSWTLDQNNGTATVYIKFRSSTGIESSCISDTIIHDDQPPSSTSISINSGDSATDDANVTLALTATDTTSVEVYVTNTTGCSSGGSYETFSSTKLWSIGQTNGVATVYIKFRDVIGNESACISDTITHDDQPPTSPTISINSGNASTSSSSVSLALGTTGADQMYITNAAGCSSGGSYEAYATIKAWTLDQANSTASVYVKFRDSAGNESSCVSDTIVHDSVDPSSVTFTAPTSNYLTSQTSFTFSWSSASDDGSGIKDYLVEKFSNSSCGTLVSSSYQTGTTFNLNPLGTVNSIKVSSRDNALNTEVGTCSADVTKGVAGQLISSFGNGGEVFTDFPNTSEHEVMDAVIQSDGKILVVGVQENVLVRYNADGSIDTSFATNGIYTSYQFGTATAVGLQSNGKIILVGTNNANDSFRLERLNSNGSLDTTFGSSGVTITDFNSSVYIVKMDIVSDLIYLAGRVNNASYSAAVARYSSNGALDTSFNNPNGVYYESNLNWQAIRSIKVQSDAKILVAGDYRNSIDNMAIFRLNSNGVSLDATFDVDGRKDLVVAGSNPSRAYDINLLTDGKILVAGQAYNGSPNWQIYIAKLNTSGALDAGFNGIGTVLISSASTNWEARSIAVQDDGKIVVGGFSSDSFDKDISIVRLTSDGSLDTSFNSSGYLIKQYVGEMTKGQKVITTTDSIFLIGDSDKNLDLKEDEFLLLKMLK